MQMKKCKKILASATAALMSFSVICAGGQLPGTTEDTAVHAATISDMPSEYQSAADWIWTNRVLAENSTGSKTARWNSLFDQIIDGKGTLNYVVRWHSTKTITLEQRQKLEVALDDCINAWTDWLVGYENWPYQHVDVNIVGWAVTDPSLLLDLQSDEIVYTDTVEYVIQTGESSEIPTTMANAPSELSRFDHFTDESYEYPGGLDKRFDEYLWATQGFPDYGGCGGDWGQRLSDNYYIGIAEGTSSKHVQIHEVGHGFGFTDFYGAEGASDGTPPGGFPGGNGSIMDAGSSSVITDFDGWFMRYTWTKIKDEAGRFDIASAQPDPTEPTTEPATEPSTEPTTQPGSESETPFTIDEYGNWIFDAKEADAVELTFSGPANTTSNGVIGYMLGEEWKTVKWEGTYDENGSFVTTVELPDKVNSAQVQNYYSAIWNNDTQEMENVSVELKNIRLIYNEADPTEPTTEPIVNTATAEFTDSIASISDNSVTFTNNGTYTFTGTDYFGGDDSKNLSFYEAGDTISIIFTYNSDTKQIISIESLDIVENSHKVKGDINSDNEFNVADIVAMQNWLLRRSGAALENWESGDLNGDSRIDIFDLAIMRKLLIGSQA